MDLCEFKASLVCKMSSRSDRATQRNPVSNKTNKGKQMKKINELCRQGWNEEVQVRHSPRDEASVRSEDGRI